MTLFVSTEKSQLSCMYSPDGAKQIKTLAAGLSQARYLPPSYACCHTKLKPF